MTARRAVLFLTLMLVAPLAFVASASSAHALGQRTQKWDNGYFKASITVNWTARDQFAVWGWIEDTKCDGRGVYLDTVYRQVRKAGGGYALDGYWNTFRKDDNGCNNGRVMVRKTRYTGSGHKVPMLRAEIYSENKSARDFAQFRYPMVWNNPFIDG